MIILKRFSQSNERRSKIKAKSKKRELEPRNVSNEEKENTNLSELLSYHDGIGTSLLGGAASGAIIGGPLGSLSGLTAGGIGGYMGKNIGEEVYRRTKSSTASKIGATAGGAIFGGTSGTVLGGPIIGTTSAIAGAGGAWQSTNSKFKRNKYKKD